MIMSILFSILWFTRMESGVSFRKAPDTNFHCLDPCFILNSRIAVYYIMLSWYSLCVCCNCTCVDEKIKIKRKTTKYTLISQHNHSDCIVSLRISARQSSFVSRKQSRGEVMASRNASLATKGRTPLFLSICHSVRIHFSPYSFASLSLLHLYLHSVDSLSLSLPFLFHFYTDTYIHCCL